jgi:pimeloyl-ACP methyl ester carboxylesterase
VTRSRDFHELARETNKPRRGVGSAETKGQTRHAYQDHRRWAGAERRDVYLMRMIARYTAEGVADAEVTRHPFATADGLGLLLTRFCRRTSDDVVLLVHGLTSSSDMFIMPEHRNLATYLLDHGFGDVWTLDHRMSNRFPYNTEPERFTLDDLAHYDHPAAIAELRRHVGDRRVHVIAHCLGSTSFAMSLFAGQVEGIATMTAQSVALVVRVPAWTRWKLEYGPVLLERLFGLSAVDPRMARSLRWSRAWALSRLVSASHPECDNPACHLISLMWGTGWPALYRHANLEPVTHERMADLLGPVSLNYQRHVRAMVRADRPVKFDPDDTRHADLPDDYLAGHTDVTTPILFLTGEHNRVFGDANVVCHRVLERRAPGRHELAVLPGYGHLDPFIGRHAHRDVFGLIVDFMRRRGGSP